MDSKKIENCKPTTYETDKSDYVSVCFNHFFDAVKCREFLLYISPNLDIKIYKKTGKNGDFFSLVLTRERKK